MNEQGELYDNLRKKWVKRTPEEEVRQSFICYLLEGLNYKPYYLKVEQAITLNSMTRRCDIVAYNQQLKPTLIVECKAPHIPITQKAFDQILNYYFAIGSRWLVLTNGGQHYCCCMSEGRAEFLERIPDGNEVFSFH